MRAGDRLHQALHQRCGKNHDRQHCRPGDCPGDKPVCDPRRAQRSHPQGGHGAGDAGRYGGLNDDINTIIRLISVMSRLNLPGVGTPISELPSRNADQTTGFRKISVAAFDRKLDDFCLNVPDSDGAANDLAGDIAFG
jgi:hypothetical protein